MKTNIIRCLTTLLIIYLMNGYSWAAATLPKDDNSVTEGIADDNFDIDDDTDTYEPITINDPYEGYNQFMFKVNDWIYDHLFLAKAYDFIVPERIQKCFYNLFENAQSPVPFFNNGFQQKYKRSAVVLGRFLVNSTVGVGGLFDPAQKFLHWPKYSEDFGQTLGFYNMKSGPYIVLPLMGPSSGRDVIGLIGDAALSPFLWLGIYEVYPEDVFKYLPYLDRINAYTYKQKDEYDDALEGAIDRYSALQNFYMQIRESRIKE